MINGKRVLTPDASCPQFKHHYEIKHKYPSQTNHFGLEQYRFKALLDFAHNTQGRVFYVIHNSRGADNIHEKLNRLDDWSLASAGHLERSISHIAEGFSLVDGRYQRVPICYWRVEAFHPLRDYLAWLMT